MQDFELAKSELELALKQLKTESTFVTAYFNSPSTNDWNPRPWLPPTEIPDQEWRKIKIMNCQ